MAQRVVTLSRIAVWESGQMDGLKSSKTDDFIRFDMTLSGIAEKGCVISKCMSLRDTRVLHGLKRRWFCWSRYQSFRIYTTCCPW